MTIVNTPLFTRWLNAQPFIRRSIGKCKRTSSTTASNCVGNNKLSFSITNSSSMFNSTNEHRTSMDIQNQRQDQQQQQKQQQTHHHQQRSIIPKTKQRRLQPNPKWLATHQQPQQINNMGSKNNTASDQQHPQHSLNPPKLVIHDFLGHFQPICFVFNTRRPPHNVPRIYNNAPIMASPFLYGHPGMVTHAINREKQRIKEYKRKQCEKRRAEKLIENGVNINGDNKQQQHRQTNSKSNKMLHHINLQPKTLSGYCENCT